MQFTKDVWSIIDRYIHRDKLEQVHRQLFEWLTWEDEGCVYKLCKCNYFYAFNWRVLCEGVNYTNVYRVPDSNHTIVENPSNVTFAIGQLPTNYAYSYSPRRR